MMGKKCDQSKIHFSLKIIKGCNYSAICTFDTSEKKKVTAYSKLGNLLITLRGGGGHCNPPLEKHCSGSSISKGYLGG